MHAYTNVTFDLYEVSVLKTVGRHLTVAFPDIHEEMPKNKAERIPDHEARVVWQLVRDTSQGTHDNVVRAFAVVNHLVTVLERESSLEHWLTNLTPEGGTKPEPSEEPTSAYHMSEVLTEARQGQLRDARLALEVLRVAVTTTTPRLPVDVDFEKIGT